LRVLALCAIAVNPWNGPLSAFEEPENGVHPRRLELIADLLTSLALEQGRQLVVTSHSPLSEPALPGQVGSPCGLDSDAPGSSGDLGCVSYPPCG
jgi:hypothetical protein